MKLVVYQTSDLHGYVYPTNYVVDQQLGILKIGSYIMKDEKNYDASLKIDCGDLTQGSALTNYLSRREFEINPVLEGMEKINYDAYILGNHEFNYGLNYLKNSYKGVSNKLLNANIENLPFESKPYEIFDFNGFKVGCIGFTTSFIPNWEQEKNIENLKFLDPVEMYGKYEKELKEKCDFIIVCYHGGFERSLDKDMVPTEALNKENQGSELLQKFDSIDILLSGHQHRSLIGEVNGVVYSQPMHNGQNFTKIVIDTETKEMSYELVPVNILTDEINPELEEIFTELNTELKEYLDEKIGKMSEDILIDDIFEARLKGHPFINFLHEVQLDVSKADFSALSLFDCAIGFKKEVSIKDVLINYPYANILRVVKIRGDKLKEAIEKSATYFVLEDGKVGISEDFLLPKVQNYNYDTYAGLDYEIDLTRKKYDRVVSMKKDNVDIKMDEYYTLVVSNYRATNTSVYPCYEDVEMIKEISLDISEIIINYIQSRDVIEVKKESNYIIKY